MATAASNVDLVASLDRIHIDIGRHHAELLTALREFDERDIYRTAGCRDAAEWLSGRYGWSRFKALRVVEAARRIPSLPAVEAALTSGRLDLDRVVELTRFAAPDTEKDLIAWARRRTVSAVRHRADLERVKAPRETKRNDTERYVVFETDGDACMMDMHARMTVEEGRTLAQAVERLAAEVPTGTAATRRADALVALASGESVPGKRPLLVVHTDLSALSSKTKCSEAGEGVIHPDVARRIACDGRIQMVLDDPTGTTRAVSSPTYAIPPRLREQVLWRDGYRCTFPGCYLAHHIDVHHMVPWPKGPTELDNLGTVCRFHHKLLHEHGWIMLLRSGRVQWRRPNGDIYDPAPVGARAGPE